MKIRRILQPLLKSKVDLHIHSNYSDGYLSVQEIIYYAHKRNLKAISITDHDTISALALAQKYCRQYGIEFINGIEISARSKNFDLHILGYFFDYHNVYLNEYVKFFQNERIKRAKKIVDRLNEIGINLTFDQVKQIAGKASIGRPHIAYAMVAKGYAKSYHEVFQNYIGDGCMCAVAKYKISPQDAISMIQQAGGICSLAHPGTDVSDEGIYELIEVGLEGIETIHPRHDQQQVDHYRKIAYENNLIETGGSDCHGKDKDSILIGQINVPYNFVDKMKEKLNERVHN